jgi:hypothetical protein
MLRLRTVTLPTHINYEEQFPIRTDSDLQILTPA